MFSNLLNSETVSRKKSDWETRHHHLLLGMDNILEYDTCSVLSLLQAAQTQSRRRWDSELKILHARWQKKHGEACREQGITFYALVIETMGAWSESAANQITKLGKSLSRATGI